MAEDMYEIGVQITADRSPAAETRFITSVQQATKDVKAEILLAPAKQSISSMRTEIQHALDNTTFQISNIQLASSARATVQQSAQSITQSLTEQMHLGTYGGITDSGLAIVRNMNEVRRLNNQFLAEAQKAHNLLYSGIPEGFKQWQTRPIFEKLTESAQTGRKEIGFFRQAIAQTGDGLTKMGNALSPIISRFMSFYAVIRVLRSVVSTVVELNDAMTQLKIVTQATDEEYQKYAHDMSRTATEIGIATKDLINASTVYARLGYSLSESGMLAKYTGMLQNVGDIDASTAQSAITSMVKAFDIDISDIEAVMDKLIIVGNNFPISVSQIAEGMMNASSSLHAAGNSIEESIALLTAANTTTQNISKASTAVRTISARLRNTKAELDELGEVVTEAKYQELVDMITGKGVSLVDEQTGELRSTYAVLSDLAKIWETIGVNEQAALATQIAGVRQQNVFYSILEQFQEAEKAMEAMGSSAGELDRAYGTYMESITAHVNQMKAAFQAFSQSILDSDMAKFFVDLGAGILRVANAIAKAASELGILKVVFGGLIASIVASNLPKIITMLAGSGIARSITAIKGLMMGGSVGNAMFAFAGGWAQIATTLTTIALVVIPLVKAAYDKLNVTLDEHQENINETQNNIDGLEDQLASVRDRMAELKSMGPLSITEADELSKLEGENAVLEARLATQKALLETQKESARYKALGATGTDADTADVIEKLRTAKQELADAQKQSVTKNDTDVLFTQQYQQLQNLKKLKDEWDSLTEVQRKDSGYATLDMLEASIANLESLLKHDASSYVNDALEKAGNNMTSAVEDVANQIETVQQLIDFLDPERDASRIRELRLELIQLYDAIGSRDAIDVSLGSLLDDRTTARVDNMVNALVHGQNVSGDIARIWEGVVDSGLVDELADIGVNIDSSDLIHYILYLVQLAKEAPAAAAANDKVVDSLNDAIGKAKKISPAMKQLNEIYADIANGKKFDFNRLLNNDDFVEAFSGLGEAYTEFLQTVASSPDDIEKTREAFNKLTEAYIDQEGVLDGLTEENRAMTAAMLEMMGVTNANEIVNATLAQQELSAAIDNVTNTLIPEIDALYTEAQASAVAGGAMLNLATNKDAVNSATIKTSADIQNILDLANAAAAGTAAITALQRAKELMDLSTQLSAQGNTKMASYAVASANAQLQYAKRAWDTSSTTFQFTGGSASGGSSGSGGSSSKDTKEYIADIERFYDAMKRLESAKLAMAAANRKLESSEDLNEKIRVTKEMLDLYNAQSEAVSDLIDVRKQSIETEAAGLRALGFEIEYNNKTNELYVANLEHINELTADSVGEYDSLEEATNELRKETEKLLDKLDEWNEANQESVEELHDLSQSLKEARQSIVDFYAEIVEKANDVVDGFQNVYKVLTDAAKEYAQTGYLSVDSLQSILDLGPKYLAMLVDENGQLVINEANLQAVIAAKTQDMAAETALSYAKQVLLATERGEEDVLRNLTDVTGAASSATWDLAFATVGLAKAIGTANGISEEYYDNAVSYLTSMQSLTETAVSTIPQYYETLKSSYISQADALDQVLKLTQDMLKWENQQAIDALNKQKDAYADIINQKKELLKLTKEEQDHEKDLAEKIAEIAKLQARIDQLSLDDSREAQAQKRKLEEELAKLQKDLASDQADYSLETQEDALDKQLEMYEDEKDDEIAALEDSLNSAEKLYQAALHELETDYNGTIERLKEWNYECGNTLQQSLLDAIDAATAALDRFGGSFKAALEGVDSYTNLGTNNTSGATTASSANDIIKTMRANSLAWWTASSDQRDVLTANQDTLAEQYRKLSGDQIYKQYGKWYHANGEQLYNLSDTEIAKAVVSKMKQNSAAWFNANETARAEIDAEQQELARRLGVLLSTSITRDASGTWWINGKKLYDVYHSGGIVGRGSFKQNEVMALLEKGEAVLDDEKQKAMYKAVDFVSTLAEKVGNAVDVGRLFGGVSPAAAGAGYASLFGRGAGVNGSLLGCNIERIDIVAPIQVVQKLDSEELKAHADMIGALSAQYIREGFTKRGVGANVTAL